MTENKFMKRLYKPKDFYRLLSDLVSSSGDTGGFPKQDQISKQFMERIMLAVTEVNGCRYCSYFHTQVSLKAGLKKEEIKRVLDGDFTDAPQDELAALYFAQHYAESAGNPNPEAVQCLKDAYGEKNEGDFGVHSRHHDWKRVGKYVRCAAYSDYRITVNWNNYLG